MFQKNRLASSVIVLAGGLFATSALANPSNPSGQLTFNDIDQNGDGQLSQSEFQAVDVQERVDHDALDTDNNGQIDESEFAAFEQASQDKMKEGRLTFSDIDEDGDGQLSQSEFQNVDVEERLDYDALDTNNDGGIDQSEFAAFEHISQDPGGQQPSESESDWQDEDDL